MARTKGAKDKGQRKIPVKTRKPPATVQGQRTIPPVRTKETPAPQAAQTSGPERPRASDEFQRRIADAIAVDTQAASTVQPGQPGVSVTSPLQPVPAADFDPRVLTRDAWRAVCEIPFWLIGWGLVFLRVIPEAGPVLEVGRRRAKDLADPSYRLWEHWANEYAGMDPGNPMHLTIGATALNAVAIVPDLVEAVTRARAAARAPQEACPPAEPAVC